jgi:hypothetical protein
MRIVPYETRIVVPLRVRDEQFYKIQELIDVKRKLLMDKQKNLTFITRQNKFLESVRDDYAKYYDYISQQKRDQIKALQVLDEYIKDLTVSGRLTKHNIEDAKEEQIRILREVKSIKESLDSIVNNTQDVQNTLDKI